MNDEEDPERFSPDGLTEQIIDVLLREMDGAVLARLRPTSELIDGTAAQRRHRRQARRSAAAVVRALPVRGAVSGPGGRPRDNRQAGYRDRPGDSGVTPTGVHDTRPGGPNRQERAHRIGAPESLSSAIKEGGMLQVRTCVSVSCDQCGSDPGGPGFEAHWPTEDAALDAAAAQGWLVGPGGRLWCSACGPVLTCEAHGHDFSQWRHPHTPDGHPTLSEYRHCRRCCLHDSRIACTDTLGEVA